MIERAHRITNCSEISNDNSKLTSLALVMFILKKLATAYFLLAPYPGLEYGTVMRKDQLLSSCRSS